MALKKSSNWLILTTQTKQNDALLHERLKFQNDLRGNIVPYAWRLRLAERCGQPVAPRHVLILATRRPPHGRALAAAARSPVQSGLERLQGRQLLSAPPVIQATSAGAALRFGCPKHHHHTQTIYQAFFVHFYVYPLIRKVSINLSFSKNTWVFLKAY